MSLVKKYNVPGPRYTSYPTVPYWQNNITTEQWKLKVKQAYTNSNEVSGISIYIHLPFCESLCTYCGCNTRITKNHAVEQPYLNALLQEWKMYIDLFGDKPHIKEIHLGGGTPTFFAAENLHELLSEIIGTGKLLKDASLSFEAHPNNTTKKHLQVLFDLGFKRLSLGIQDFDLKVQETVNRLQSFEQVKEVTDQAREIGYTSVNFDLIYGLPFQTAKGVTDTINKVIRLKPDRIAYYSYAHVPWIKPGQRKFTELDLPDDETKRELYEAGKELLQQAGYIEIGMDHFALKSDSLFHASQNGTLHRNFMGYTDQYTKLMIGLGVSSIGDTWDAFAQNVKTVEEYYQKIQNGEIPILRGHILNKEELIIRHHILNIMCTLKTSWADERWCSNEVLEGVKRLGELIEDQLVAVQDQSLEVTEKGRAFIRNICMAFDASLHREKPIKQIFSKTI